MSKKITLFFFVCCMLISPFALRAQEVTVTGKVTGRVDGQPLPGVTVTLQGTNRATITNATGFFTILAPTGGKLVFAMLGMQSQTVTVAGAELNVSLVEDETALNEVVVVGYGTQKKSVVTGSITSVKASELETMPVNRIEQSLQGRTSGLTIAANSGQPGEAATVRLRGITSFRDNASNPLWVVDGIVVDNGGISYLNQSDIESIEVLKDAASQAIYGTRAAAGVILITTKRGKAGSIKVDYTGYYGTSAPARKLSLLNATEYATLRNEAAAADGKTLPFADPASFGQGTDWQEAIFNNDARRQNHEFSISGGG
ncbi:MAG: SusC/RagA family TonB-linked outer membrane protein, partial [Pedobacter sp.]